MVEMQNEMANLFVILSFSPVPVWGWLGGVPLGMGHDDAEVGSEDSVCPVIR